MMRRSHKRARRGRRGRESLQLKRRFKDFILFLNMHTHRKDVEGSGGILSKNLEKRLIGPKGAWRKLKWPAKEQEWRGLELFHKRELL